MIIATVIKTTKWISLSSFWLAHFLLLFCIHYWVCFIEKEHKPFFLSKNVYIFLLLICVYQKKSLTKLSKFKIWNEHTHKNNCWSIHKECMLKLFTSFINNVGINLLVTVQNKHDRKRRNERRTRGGVDSNNEREGKIEIQPSGNWCE